jgi:hypothetical protein
VAAAVISGDIQMFRTDGNPEPRDFGQVIRFLHRPILFLVATVLVGAVAAGLVMIPAQAATMQTGDGTRPRITGHRFEPGPIVNGHHRQPTSGEIEARTRELWTRSKTGSGAS